MVLAAGPPSSRHTRSFGTAPKGDESDVRRVNRRTGEVLERVKVPAEVGVRASGVNTSLSMSRGNGASATSR